MEVIKNKHYSYSKSVDDKVLYYKRDYGWYFVIYDADDKKFLEKQKISQLKNYYPTKEDCIEAAISFYNKTDLGILSPKTVCHNEYAIEKIAGININQHLSILKDYRNNRKWRIQEHSPNNYNFLSLFKKEIREMQFNTRLDAIKHLEWWLIVNKFTWI